MSVSLYLDENVPRAVAVGLRLRGVDVTTAQDDGRGGLADPLLLDRATELGASPSSRRMRIFWPKHRGARRQAFRFRESSTHQLYVTIGDCVRDLHLIAEAMHPDEVANRVEFLPL